MAARYRAVQGAIIALNPNSPSLQHLRELKQSDVCCPQREDKQLRPGESRRELSWIWLSEGGSAAGRRETTRPISEEDINDSECTFSLVCLILITCQLCARSGLNREHTPLVGQKNTNSFRKRCGISYMGRRAVGGAAHTAKG